MAHYIDKHGTKIFIDSSMSDKELTDAINSEKLIAEKKRTNDIAEKMVEKVPTHIENDNINSNMPKSSIRKKYQVFVSSTYSDLTEERSAVMQCLLEMNCIPVGMEQFPASNMKQMDYIRMMLNDCDYYILILAGRYGSLDSDGVGFTEKEYDYAIKHNIPVMSFVIEDTGKLVSSKCETTDIGREKLDAFRAKVCDGKLVKFFSDIGTLKAAVAVSLNRCIQDFPAVGWIRGNDTELSNPDEALKEKVLKILENDTATAEDIEKLFADEVAILADGTVGANSTVNIAGMTTTLEELSKNLPRIEQSDKCFHTSDEDDLLPDGTSRKIVII